MTLVELLTAASLAIVLVSIALHFAAGAHRTAAQQRALAELAYIQGALDSYRRHFGDYPHTTDPAQLCAALSGKRAPRGEPVVAPSFIQPELVRVTPNSPGMGPPRLLDPWNRPYEFHYMPPSLIAEDGGYHLYSAGPDGAAWPPDSHGRLARDHPDNLDNVFADS